MTAFSVKYKYQTQEGCGFRVSTVKPAGLDSSLGRTPTEGKAMEYRNLGRSGLKVSPLCLGTMMFGDATDEPAAARIIARAAEQGVNFIDTADVYNDGRSEEIAGRAIAANRGHWVLATKFANPTGSGPNDRGLSRRHAFRAVEASLKRLGTDVIDILYLHREDPATTLAETVGAIAGLIRAGHIRYFGVSNIRAWRIAEICHLCDAAGIGRPVVSQPYYNMLNRMPEAEQLPACAFYGLGVAPYSPLARGVLTGKYLPGAAPDAGTRAGRGDKRIMETEFRPESLVIAQEIVAHARSRGVTPGPVRHCLAAQQPAGDQPDRRTAHRGAMGGLPRRADLPLHSGGRGAGRPACGARPSLHPRLQRSGLSARRQNYRLNRAVRCRCRPAPDI